jgi:hypothetical protein
MNPRLFTIMLLTVLFLSCATSGGGAQSGAAAIEPPASPATVITLQPKDAKLATQDRLVYNADADCVAWWEKKTDEITWTLTIKEAGDYFVIAQVACDPQFPGSTVGVTINNVTLTFDVPDTLSWSNYKSITAGKITLQPGTYPVLVKAIKVPDRFVANLRKLLVEK